MSLSLEDYINEVLFQADLLNTCCVANEAHDEYQYIAKDLHGYIECNGHTICKEMLEELLQESLSLEEDDDTLFSVYVSQTKFDCVINDLKAYLINHFSE